MPEPQKQKLEDVLNYKPPSRISDEDLATITAAFKGNDKLVAAIKRVMIPSIFETEAPEFMGTDRWMDLDFAPMQSAEVKSVVLARQWTIKFICGGLIQMKIIANQGVESPISKELRDQKNSNQ